MFCIDCHQKLTECKCKKQVINEMTLSNENVIQQLKPRAVVAMLCTTAMGKNLSPLLLAKAYELQGFDKKEHVERFAMAVAVNRRRTFVTKEMLDQSDEAPKLRLIPTLGGALPRDIFCVSANDKAREILKSLEKGESKEEKKDSRKEKKQEEKRTLRPFLKEGKLDKLEEDIFREVDLVRKFDAFPLVAVGFTWTLTWRLEGLPKKEGKEKQITACTDAEAEKRLKQGFVVWAKDWTDNIAGCTPFGQFRKMAKVGAEPLVAFFQSFGGGVFVHVGDSDPVSLFHKSEFPLSGTVGGLISRYHAALDEYANDKKQPHEPCVLTGGYKVSFGKTDGETFEYLATAVEQEMEIRTLLHDVHADLPYYSEANLLLNCSTPQLFDLVDFGASDLEWNAYRTRLKNSKIITMDRGPCHLALKWDPRCVLTTHAGRMHDTFVSSPPKLAQREEQDIQRPIWNICCDETPVLRLLVLREESVLSEFARKTVDYLARAVLGQIVQATIGSRHFAAMLFKMGQIERSSKTPTPVNDPDVRPKLKDFVKDLESIGVFDRVELVKNNGPVKSLKEMASDLLTPLTQVAMSSAKFKGLRMGGDKLEPTNRVIGLKQFYLLGMLGAYNSVEDAEDSAIKPEEPYSLGLLPYLMGHEEVVIICEKIFETVWQDVTERASNEILIIKETPKKDNPYKKAEELLFKSIRSSVEELYERELKEPLEILTKKSIVRFGDPRDKLCDVIPVVLTNTGILFTSICAVPISALAGSSDTLPESLLELAKKVFREAKITCDGLSTATLELAVAPNKLLDKGEGDQGDGDIWTGPNTVIPKGGIFEMDL